MIKTTQETIYNAVGQHTAIIYAEIIAINTNYDEKSISIVVNYYIINDGIKQQIRNVARNYSFQEYAEMVQLIKSQVPEFNSLEDTKDRELELAIYGFLYINNQEKPYGATRELSPLVEEEVLPVE